MIKNSHFLLLRQKMHVIWRTGLPLRVGLFDPGCEFAPSIPAIGAIKGDTVWLDRTLLENPEILRGVVEHEVLHARYAQLRRSARKSMILQRAGASAYAVLSARHEMAELLQHYEKAELNTHEEALVMLVGSGEQVTCPDIARAARLLRRSGGWNPLNLLRAACWIPVIIWTRQASENGSSGAG